MTTSCHSTFFNVKFQSYHIFLWQHPAMPPNLWSHTFMPQVPMPTSCHALFHDHFLPCQTFQWPLPSISHVCMTTSWHLRTFLWPLLAVPHVSMASINRGLSDCLLLNYWFGDASISWTKWTHFPSVHRYILREGNANYVYFRSTISGGSSISVFLKLM